MPDIRFGFIFRAVARLRGGFRFEHELALLAVAYHDDFVFVHERRGAAAEK